MDKFDKFTVLWTDEVGEGHQQIFELNQKEEANCFYLQKLAEGVDDLIAMRPDGTFITPKKVAKKAYAIEAKFSGNSKVYTYPSRKPVSVGDTLIVNSPYGIGLPVASSCREVEESTLPSLCKTPNPHCLNWVIGTVNKF